MVVLACCSAIAIRRLYSRGAMAFRLQKPIALRASTGSSSRLYNSDAAFEAIRLDQIRVPVTADEWTPTGVNIVDYGELVQYTRELSKVLHRSTFLGTTTVKDGEKATSSAAEIDGAILHFRDPIRATVHCLYFMTVGYPLLPCPSVPYKSGAERALNFFEKTMSGTCGLRVHKIHCPFIFQPIIAIDLQCADSIAMQSEERYRIAITASGSKRHSNECCLMDLNDNVILATSKCCDDEDFAKKFGIGSIFNPRPSSDKVIPDASDTFETFLTRFKGHEHQSLLKAMINLYHGIDAHKIQDLANQCDVLATCHVSKVESLESFYKVYIDYVRKCTVDTFSDVSPPSEGSESDPVAEVDAASTATANPPVVNYSIVEDIFRRWASNMVPYRHNREAEQVLGELIETQERLSKIRDQCIAGGPQQADRLAKVEERLDNLTHYQKALEATIPWNKCGNYQLLQTVRRELVVIGDLVGYKRRPRINEPPTAPAVQKDLEAQAPKRKRGISLKGIKYIKLEPANPESPIVIAGKSAKTNEIVTTHLAKPGDLWLHAKDVPGSHVLLRRFENSASAIQKAANVAAFISKAKGQGQVPVCVTNISNVEKQPQAELGAVLVRDFKTINGYSAQGKEIVHVHTQRELQLQEENAAKMRARR